MYFPCVALTCKRTPVAEGPYVNRLQEERGGRGGRGGLHDHDNEPTSSLCTMNAGARASSKKNQRAIKVPLKHFPDHSFRNT